MKQIMTKNPNSVWLRLLIFKDTPMPRVAKTPEELLDSRKLRTNLPMIDLNCNYEYKVETLTETHNSKMPLTGKKLPEVDVGSKVPYGQNLIVQN